MLAKFDEINSVSNQLNQCLVKADRRKLEIRNDLLRKMLEGNRVIVFPSPPLHTWNGIPRFNFIEANLKEVEACKLPQMSNQKRRTESVREHKEISAENQIKGSAQEFEVDKPAAKTSKN